MALPLLYVVTLKEQRVNLTWKDNLLLMVIGIAGIGIPQTALLLADKLVGAGIVSMLLPLSTIFTVCMSGILRMEPIGWLKGFGITAAILGTLGITLITQTDFESNSVWGVVIMIAHDLGWSTYLILLSLFLKRKPIPLFAYFRATIWGMAFVFPFALSKLPGTDWAEIPYWVWLVEVYCAVLVSSGAHVMMSWLIRHCSALLPALYACILPLFTVFLAILFLGETFSVKLLLCMFTILGGLIIVIIAKAKENKEKMDTEEDSRLRTSSNYEIEAPLLGEANP